MSKRTKDLLLAVFFIVFGAIILLLINSQVRIMDSVNRGTISGQTFPYLSGILMVVSSVGLLLHTIFQKDDQAEPDAAAGQSETEVANQGSLIRVVLVTLLLLVYIFVMNKIGFILSGVLFGFGFLFITGIRKWWQYVILAVVVTAMFALFKNVLYVPLPTLGIV